MIIARRTPAVAPFGCLSVALALAALVCEAHARPQAEAELASQADRPAQAAGATTARAAADSEAEDVEPSQTRRPARPASRARDARSAPKFGVAHVLAEVAQLPEHPQATGSAWLKGSPYVQWQASRAWELRAGVQLRAERQSGTDAYEDAALNIDETYLRWRTGESRLTVGAQKIVWGRVDGVPLIDRVSRADISRGLLDDLEERRQAQWAVRWEHDWDTVKLDAVVLPAFLAADLPDARSVWNPVNRRTGQVIGIAPNPALAALAAGAPATQDDGGWGGAAVRLTSTGFVDLGLSVGRTRQSLPFYEANAARGGLDAVHPFNRFVGVDAEWVGADITWRGELVYTRDLPLTSLQGQRVKASALDWIGAVEFFPGGKDTRVNLQLMARSLQTDGPVLQLTRYVGVNGEIESTFGQGRWKAGLQFASGLSVHDMMLAPRLSFVGWEPHELSLSVQGFRGNERTLGGFYRDNVFVALALRSRF